MNSVLQVTLTEEDFKRIIVSQEARLQNLGIEDDSDEGDEDTTVNETSESGAVKRKRGGEDDDDDDDAENEDEEDDEEEEDNEDMDVDDIAKKYGLNDYDEEEEGGGDGGSDEEGDAALGLGGVSYYKTQSEDPYLSRDTDDEEAEDERIEAEDNMVVVGKLNNDCCQLEVYVYSQAEENLFCHHDILLPSMPLALEWLNFDPSEDSPGNYIAMGTMEPDIEVWDLDVIDTVEPAFVLAGASKKKKGSKKKKKTSSSGHSDAVLDLSWNMLQPKVLGSASADFTVGIWDLTNGTMVTSINHHEEKVQSLAWHPFEAQSLLSGSFDHTARVYDCRSPKDSHKTWRLPGEVERVVWNPHDPYYFLASSDTGHVYYLDVRNSEPVFTLQAHHGAVTGLSVSQHMPGCVMTASQDKYVKVWDIRGNKPSLVLEKEPKMGGIHCVGSSPDSALIFAVGGEQELRVMNLHKNVDVAEHFGTEAVAGDEDAELLGVAGAEDNAEEEEMLGAAEAVAGAAAQAEKKKKKKKKKKKQSANAD